MEETDFTQSWSKSDVIFEVEQKKLYFSRGVLAFHSDVFERMFNTEFAESDPEKVIPLPDKKFEDVQAMLCVLRSSPKCPNPINEQNLSTLLALSDEYAMPHLAADCGKYMVAHWKAEPSKFLKAVAIAFEYGLRHVAEVFLPLSASCALYHIDQYCDLLPLEVYAAIMHARLLGIQREYNHYLNTDHVPTDDPKIQAVLENFAKMSQKKK